MLTRLKSLWSEERCREDARQFVWFALGYAVALVLGYLLLREINLALCETEMGRYSYVTSFVGVVSLALSLAAPQAYLRFHDENRHSPQLRRILLPLFALASFGVAAILWFSFRSPFALLFAAQPFFDERVYAFRGQMRAVSANVLKVAQIAVPLVGVCVLARTGWCGDMTAALVFGLYGLGYLTAFLIPLRLTNCAAPDRKTVLKYLGPVMVTLFAGAFIYDLSVIVAKQFFGYEAAARMGVAARNLIFVRALFTVFMMLFPVIYFREMKAGRIGTVRVYRLLIVGAAAVFCALMVLFAPLLYRVTGAAAYLDAVNLFRFLTAAAFCDFLFDVCGLYFQHAITTWKNTCVKLLSMALLLAGVAVVAHCRSAGDADSLTLLAVAVLFAAFVSSSVGVAWALVSERRYGREAA